MPAFLLLDEPTADDSLRSFAPCYGLLPVSGRPAAAQLIEAAASCGDVDSLTLLGPEAYLESPQLLRMVNQFSPAVSVDPVALDSALVELSDAGEVLIWPAANPLLAPEVIEAFLMHVPPQTGLAVCLVREARVASLGPRAPRARPWRMAGEEFCFGALTLVRPDILGTHLRTAAALIASGWSHHELTRLLGIGLGLRLNAGHASLPEVVARLGEVLGSSVLGVVLPYPEVAIRLHRWQDFNWLRDRVEAAA